MAQAKTQLTDIEVNEISPVDRGANGKRFAIVKRSQMAKVTRMKGGGFQVVKNDDGAVTKDPTGDQAALGADADLPPGVEAGKPKPEPEPVAMSDEDASAVEYAAKRLSKVAKAGRKMAKNRLDRFKAALATLQALLEEMDDAGELPTDDGEGAADGSAANAGNADAATAADAAAGADEAAKGKEPPDGEDDDEEDDDDETAEKMAKLAESIAALTKAVEGSAKSTTAALAKLDGRIGGVESKVQKQAEALAKAAGTVTPSAGLVTDPVPTRVTKGTDDVLWPMDLAPKGGRR